MDFRFIQQLESKYGPSVFRRATEILGDREAGKDVMEEVFLRALWSRLELAASSSPLGWFYRVTTELCLDRLRAAGATCDAFSSLPAELQEVAIYFFLDQMSREEIASILSVPRRTVADRLERFSLLSASRSPTRTDAGGPARP